MYMKCVFRIILGKRSSHGFRFLKMVSSVKNVINLQFNLIFQCNVFSEDNSPLREFLRARNPKQQHSATLESYLIKPIQRILKYPLLLNQLRSLTERETDEHYHLSGKSKNTYQVVSESVSFV